MLTQDHRRLSEHEILSNQLFISQSQSRVFSVRFLFKRENATAGRVFTNSDHPVHISMIKTCISPKK